MPKCSSQDPALGGSIVSSAKRTDELPSKHNQARRGAKRQSSSSMPKVSCNDYSFNSFSQRMDGWNKPVIWAQKEDDNTKGEVAGWPRWETVSNQTFPGDAYEDDSTIACKRSWIESEDGNAKRVTGEGGDAIYHDGLDKWRQSCPNIHMADKNSLSKSACWDRPAHSNGKQETGGWTRWPEAMSKTIGQYNSHQNSKGCWNQSEGWTTSKDSSTMACKRDWNEYGDEREKKENGCDSFDHDGNGWRQSRSNIHIVDKGSSRKSASWDHAKYETANRENNGWHRWSGSMTKTTRQFPSHQKKKGYRNQSERWTTSEDGSAMACKRGWNESGDEREKREIHGDATDHDDGDGWRQSRSNIHLGNKGSLSKSASLDRAKYENVKRENDGWPGAMSETTRQSTGHQDRKGYLNQTEGWTTSQNGSTMACKRGWNESGDGREERENGGDVFDQDSRDGWRLSGSNHSIDKGSLSKSASWDGAKDENAKRENDGWCRWPEAMSKTTRQCTSQQNSQSKGWTTSKDDSNMACTRGWNESGDGKEKRETADGGDAFNHDGRDGWKSSSSNIHRVDKGSLSKSASWDRAKDENAKRDNDGWPGWPGAMPKTIEQFPSHQNRKVGRQSQGWTASDDGYPQKETSGRNPDLVQSGDPWMQRGSMMLPKCDWNKPVTWNASKDDGLDRGQRKWDPGLDQTGGDPWKQISSTVLPKAGRRKFGSATVAQGENSIRRKSKWNGSANFSDPYASKQHRLRWGASMPSTSEQCPSSQNRKDGWNQSWGRIPSEYGDSLKENNGRIADLDRSNDPWMEHRLMMLPKCDWNKSASWSETGGNDQTGRDPWEQLNPPELPKFGNSFRKIIKLSAAPDFGDPNAPKQNMHIFLPKNDGKRLFRGRGRTPYHASEHEHYQSNDTCNTYKKVSGGVSAYDGDSPLGRSQSGSLVRNQISDAVRKHPDSDTDEFWDSKKARYPGHDRRTSFEDPWKQMNHLQDQESSKHWSRNDEAGENKLFPNDTSYDRFPREKGSYHDSFSDRGCPVKDKCKEIWHDRRDSNPCDDKWDQKNTGNVSSWNFSKFSSKIIVKDSLSQSHLMRDDERFKDNTIMSMGTTPVQNVDQNVTNSPHVCQQSAQNLGSHIDDQTDHSSPIQRQNVQVSSQLPFRTKNSNPNGQCQKPPSNPKDEVQNHEQQAVLNIRDSLTTEAITVLVSSSDPVFVQAPINTEELKTSSKKVEQVPITVGISDFSKKIIETMNFPYSKSWNTYQFEPVNVQAKGETYSGNYEQHVGPNEELNGRMDEKGIRMFKFAIAEFVKETIKPVWNDGRLSKEAHKTVVKKVVDKVVGVLGTNIPQTQERIDQYLSYAKDKLHKLVQDYLEMFINT